MALGSSLVRKVKSLFRRGGVASDQATAVELRDAVAARSGDDAASLAKSLAAGAIDLATFQREMFLLTRNSVVSQYGLARGGVSALTAADREAIESVLSRQMGYLRRFTQDIATGTLSEQAIATRASLYADAGVEAHARGQAAAYGVTLPDEIPPAHGRCRCRLRHDTEDGAPVVWWETRGDERVCETCSTLAARYSPWRGRVAA